MGPLTFPQRFVKTYEAPVFVFLVYAPMIADEPEIVTEMPKKSSAAARPEALRAWKPAS
jgi:hypothetical protein